MVLTWDFSITNALLTVLVVGGLNWYLYRRLCREFDRDVSQIVRLHTAPVAEMQIAERLDRIEEGIARLVARDEHHHDQIERLQAR